MRFGHTNKWLGGMWMLILAVFALGIGEFAHAQTATYRVTFQGNWTTASTPGGVAPSAHFTTLIGAVHNRNVTFWRSGGVASPGIEQVAETGLTGSFGAEIQRSPHAFAVIQRGVSFGGTGRATFDFRVPADHPLITLVSMIGPARTGSSASPGCPCGTAIDDGCPSGGWPCIRTTPARRTEPSFP